MAAFLSRPQCLNIGKMTRMCVWHLVITDPDFVLTSVSIRRPVIIRTNNDMYTVAADKPLIYKLSGSWCSKAQMPVDVPANPFELKMGLCKVLRYVNMIFINMKAKAMIQINKYTKLVVSLFFVFVFLNSDDGICVSLSYKQNQLLFGYSIYRWHLYLRDIIALEACWS